MATLREKAFNVHGKSGCIETRRSEHTSLFLSWWESSTGTEYMIRHGIHGGGTILSHFIPWWKDFRQEFVIGSVLQLKAAQDPTDYYSGAAQNRANCSGVAQAQMRKKPQ